MIDYRQFAQAESLQLEPVADPPMPVWFKIFCGLVFVGVTVAFAWSGAR